MKPASLWGALRDLDASRPSLPGEHWASFGLGLYLLLRRRPSAAGRLASMAAGAAFIARALGGRDGAISMWRRASQRKPAEAVVDVAMPWPYEERVRIARPAPGDGA